jgi:hypothetical protein
MTTTLALTVLVLLAASASAPATRPPAPKSTQARDALAKARRAVEAAEDAYTKALADAKRTLVQDLRAAERAAPGQKDADEAAAIATAISGAEAELALLSGRVRVTVKAAAGWQRVGTLPRGTYRLTGSGTWSNNGESRFGPAGSGVDDGGVRNLGVLQARVRDRVVDVGANGAIGAEGLSEFYLRMADSRFDDNTGEVQVEVRRIEGGESPRELREVQKSLAGTWAIRSPEWNEEWTFTGDGRMTTAAGVTAVWVLDAQAGSVLIRLENGKVETLLLPLKPDGTKGRFNTGSEFTATKK